MEAIELRPMDLVTIALFFVVILLLIRTLILGGKLKRLRRSYLEFMDGSGVNNLEEILIMLQEQMQVHEYNHTSLSAELEKVKEQLRSKKGNVGVHRYNAFSEPGSNLSFSFAIVDDKQTGMVLSGLHARDTTYLYAKPVKEGQSEYTLTEEEKKALSLALQQEDS
ncbi:DUF4446 family protein [Paenibacillus sp. GCM10027626]|uniref:DUF4446 family protein n=1 Tax=Paenibacillus sp. GCM10027626 TaxID=3273411 RepID=UPI00362816B7